MSDLYLAHHGIPGQKWGVRRYQNPDGTLTEEGKRRARKDAESGNEWATGTNQPSSFKSSVLAGFYAATGNKKLGEMLNRSNNEDNIRWKEAQKSYEKISGHKITEVSKNTNTKLAEKYVNDYIDGTYNLTTNSLRPYINDNKTARRLDTDNKNTTGKMIIKNNKLVGAVNVETKNNGEKWIQGLEVYGDNKGKGYGKQLLKTAVNDLGATHLSVRKTNKVAKNLYDKNNFEIYDEDDYMYYMKLKKQK